VGERERGEKVKGNRVRRGGAGPRGCACLQMLSQLSSFRRFRRYVPMLITAVASPGFFTVEKGSRYFTAIL